MKKNKSNHTLSGLITGIALLIAGAGCVAAVAPAIETYQAYNIGQGGIKAAQSLQPIGLEEEKSIGGSLAIQVFNRFGPRREDPALQRYVSLVGHAIAEVSDRPDIDYYFAVVDSDTPNAFAAPGGYVFLSTGLLKLAQNEAQLAGVLGHEVAHISEKHALKTMERSKKLSGFGALSISLLGQDPALFDKVLEQAMEILFTHGLDKELEYEADKVGSEYAARLGYAPSGLNDFLGILEKSLPGGSSALLSTHPGPADRSAKLISQLANHHPPTGPLFGEAYLSAVRGRL
ncbi:MAG: M48 family metalloprotease [Candidatus Nitrohelix vancouverensis]|uniref:M48 family metalloprotease n=1 Tax=Candidatus Nitrohelix vancouverensis TaxID=2705534 RepID=A0A7T0C472_9BACT|nr:MAG: M48 family metalloprotease [Candidatus Nitrohelix vancouverensis]